MESDSSSQTSEEISQDVPQNIPQDLSQDTASQNTPQNIQDISPDDSGQTTGVKKSRSMVHNHFILDRNENKYKCNYCGVLYKVSKDGSTSSLRKHLKSKHNDKWLGIDQVTDAINKLEISDSLVHILFYFIFNITCIK